MQVAGARAFAKHLASSKTLLLLDISENELGDSGSSMRAAASLRELRKPWAVKVRCISISSSNTIRYSYFGGLVLGCIESDFAFEYSLKSS